MYQFKFADIGEGLHEGKVGEIYKKVGDKVKEGEPLFSVETDKVTSDIPSPVDGVVAKVLMKVGATIHVGDVIYEFETNAKAPSEAPKAAPKAAPVSEGGASVVGEVKVSNELFNPTQISSKPATSANQLRAGSVSSIIKLQDKILTTPLARALAKEKGIDISQVAGSGFNGRVLMHDILNFKGKPRAEAGPAGPAFIHQIQIPSGQSVEVPITSMRKAIAKAMTNSWTNVAYTNLVVEVNMTKLWNHRKKVIETSGQKVSFTAFIMKATVLALQEFPMLNARYDSTKELITRYGNINLGIAVDTKEGLVVPNVPASETKDLFALSDALNTIATKARDRKLTMKEMSGGTFTITNYGTVGALYGVPVINYPEIGILGTGTIQDRVFVGDNFSFYAGKVMHLTCAADHRWVDGGDIGRFLSRVKEILENPTWMTN